MTENRGREAGQWLCHIVQNYDNLADVTFFVQADLGASFGVSGSEWPQDLNVFKKFRLPNKNELGPIDDFSFYVWPSFDRIRCVVGEPGLGEEHIRGFGPKVEADATEPEVRFLWENAPKNIRWPTNFGMAYLGGQHVVTRKFIRRLPKSYYSNAWDAVKKHELAHWLEFGKWPTIVYDIFRQGPLAKRNTK